MSEMPDNTDNGFKLLWEWFVITMKKPLKCVIFWVYFIVGVLLFGGAGIWSLWFSSSKPSLLMAVCSFYLAIAGASCMDFIFSEDERKYIRGFSIFWAMLLCVLTLFAFFKENYWIASLATIISLVLWWLANAENPKLTDIARPLSPVGGDANGEVNGTAGDISI